MQCKCPHCAELIVFDARGRSRSGTTRRHYDPETGIGIEPELATYLQGRESLRMADLCAAVKVPFRPAWTRRIGGWLTLQGWSRVRGKGANYWTLTSLDAMRQK